MLSLTGASTGVAVVSIVAIVLGYGVCVALWYFMVKRPSRDERDPPN